MPIVKVSIENQEKWLTTKYEVLGIIFIFIMSEELFYHLGNRNRKLKNAILSLGLSTEEQPHLTYSTRKNFSPKESIFIFKKYLSHLILNLHTVKSYILIRMLGEFRFLKIFKNRMVMERLFLI